MILIRRHAGARAEEIELDEFVPAQSLELYQGLYAQGLLTFRRYFHLARMPYVTLALITVLVVTYLGWQGGRPEAIEALVQQGAKSPPLMRELGQWWRLLTANALHISAWHLLVNAVFLFNLGGPAEAVFRRLDYVLIVVVSGVAAMLLSTVTSPSVSCGASGIVFGVWGAADNWSHLGGLAAGSALAMVLPPRLLAPRDPWAHAKLLALAALALLVAALSFDAPGVGPLSGSRYYPATGIVVPVPRRWDMIAQERTRNHESYAFANGAGVAVALLGRLEAHPVSTRELGRRFIERDLAAQLEAHESRGHRIHEPVPVQVAGVMGERVDAEIAGQAFVAHATYVIVARGYYHYVVSFTAPYPLAEPYRPTLAAIIAGLAWVEPDLLATAKRRLREDTPLRHAELATALAQTGLWQAAEDALAQAAARWPGNAEIARTVVRLRDDRQLTVEAGAP